MKQTILLFVGFFLLFFTQCQKEVPCLPGCTFVSYHEGCKCPPPEPITNVTVINNNHIIRDTVVNCPTSLGYTIQWCGCLPPLVSCPDTTTANGCPPGYQRQQPCNQCLPFGQVCPSVPANPCTPSNLQYFVDCGCIPQGFNSCAAYLAFLNSQQSTGGGTPQCPAGCYLPQGGTSLADCVCSGGGGNPTTCNPSSIFEFWCTTSQSCVLYGNTCPPGDPNGTPICPPNEIWCQGNNGCVLSGTCSGGSGGSGGGGGGGTGGGTPQCPAGCYLPQGGTTLADCVCSGNNPPPPGPLPPNFQPGARVLLQGQSTTGNKVSFFQSVTFGSERDYYSFFQCNTVNQLVYCKCDASTAASLAMSIGYSYQLVSAVPEVVYLNYGTGFIPQTIMVLQGGSVQVPGCQ
jgi:hypothetical protein